MKRFAFFIAILFSIFQEKGTAADYFWVGGSGDWSDISHWATSSGGTVKFAVTPSAVDNVIFDENSFPTTGAVLTINNDIAFAANLTFRNITTNPTIRSAANNTLNIYGNITLIPQITFQCNGNIHFLGNAANKIINLANHSVGNNVLFSGQGSWTLNSNLNIGKLLEIVEGTVSMGNNQVNAEFFKSTSTLSRTINFENSRIRISGVSNVSNPFWIGDPRNKYTVQINATNWTSTNVNSRFELSSAFNHILVSNPGTIILPTILASSTFGRTQIINEFNNTTLGIDGDVDLKHDTEILSSMSLQNLLLTPGYNYTLLGGGMFSLNAVIAAGNCSALVSINANPAGMPANLNISAPTNLTFTILQDIKFAGAPATANNSVNLGNNSGITISEKNSQTLYWIGRSGNWSNPANWSLSSGGPPSGCLPTLIDDVVFDANSFNANGQIVSFNALSNSYCKNMTWTGVRQDATLDGRDSIRMFVSGSLEFSPAMKQEYRGDFVFIGSNQQTIKVAGKKFNGDVIFNNAAGSWTLLDKFYVEKICYFRSGKLIFDNIDANFNRFISDLSTPRSLELKNSELNIEVRNSFCGLMQIHAENLTIDPGKSHLHFRNSSCGGLSIIGNNDIRFHNITSSSSSFYMNNYDQRRVTANHLKILKSADFYSRCIADTMTITGGHQITMVHKSVFTVNNLIANTPCNTFVNISMVEWLNNEVLIKPTFILSKPHSFSRFSLSDIIVQAPAIVPLVNSIDRGGNSGWQFSNTTGRTLYWVGGSGDWSEQSHWSLISGGTGGECIPTEIDDVIFDNRSFSSNNGFVGYNNSFDLVAFCKNFTFDVPGFTGTISHNLLNVYGNLTIRQAFNYNIYRTEFRAEKGIQFINAPNTNFNVVGFLGKSEVQLLSNLRVLSDLRCNDGSFDTNSYDISVGTHFYAGNSNIYKNTHIKLRKSKVTINGTYTSFNQPLLCYEFLKLDGDSSFIEFTSLETAMIINSKNCTFGEILSSNISGHMEVATLQNTHIRKMTFRGNGEFINKTEFSTAGIITLDTLIFSAGKTYVYQSTYAQNINKYLQARGNNCNPISISSSVSGQKATINMPSTGIINMDFVQMRDMRGTGGANFNAGPYSTNINNSNENWTFPGVTAITASVGFLGADRFICPGSNGVILDANSYTPTETYRWSNGSTSASINAQNSGNYAVTVTFANNCKVIDTINITKAQDIGRILPRDTSLCNQSSYTLNAVLNDPNARYLWNNGMTTTSLNINTNGKYTLQLTKDGCTFLDSTQVSFINIQALNLGADRSVCQGTNVLLDVQSSYPLIRWQDGSTNQTLSPTVSGLYWVEVGSSQCKVRDSVNLVFKPTPFFHFGPDTTLCGTRSTIKLTTGNTPGSTVWQDGSSANDFTAKIAGTYFAIKTSDGCTHTDTIKVNKILIGEIDPVLKLERCEGDSFTTGYANMGAKYSWSQGLNPTPVFVNGIPSGEQVKFTKSGMYWVDIEVDGCKVRDSFDLNFRAAPVFSLGNDTSFCQGSSIVLSHGVVNGQVQWNDGSTAPSITAQTNGQYFAKVTKNGCSFSDTVNILVKPIPSVNLGPDTSLCENTTLTLNAGSGPGTLLWNINTTQPQIVVTSGGQYSVTKTLNGCSKSDTINVSYLALQRPDIGKDTSFCEGGAAQLKDLSSAQNVKYLWSDGSTGTSINASKSGIYWLESSISQCRKRDSISISVLSLPKVTSPKDYSFCEGKNVSISLQGDFETLSWDDFPAQRDITVSSAKSYRYTMSKSICTKRDTINVREVIIPDPGIGDYVDRCRGEAQILTVNGFNGNIKWSNGAQAKSIQVVSSGTYVVTLTDAGCVKSDSVFVGFFDCNGDFLYFPNIISTGSTDGNDKFMATVAEKYTLTDYKLSIYDRYGNLMFTSEDINVPWDGLQFGSRAIQPGVYAYICTASAEGPKKFENKKFTGTVTVLK